MGSSREDERPWEVPQTGDKKVTVPDGLWLKPSERDDSVERLMLTLTELNCFLAGIIELENRKGMWGEWASGKG